ncbi:MAG: orotate phosphoribosyltransferase [Bacteroidota bacterium]|nr:orotate phosphoribosyltransferase [Candidatus Kapabacteria bacterium]MDW8219617.1 orotate phosphoribosyltransferase [Bacteroidota bacterium]
MEKEALAYEIFRVAHLTGRFTLRSGATSTEYFDKYLFEGKPELLREIARHLAALIPENIEVLAGLEMGGIPIVTALSLETNIPAAFVRKKAKEYGTQKLAEGTNVTDKLVLVVEDVITSGGQVIASARDLQGVGANIHSVLCVIDREQGGREKLAESGLYMRALFTMSELKASYA